MMWKVDSVCLSTEVPWLRYMGSDVTETGYPFETA